MNVVQADTRVMLTPYVTTLLEGLSVNVWLDMKGMASAVRVSRSPNYFL